MSAARWVRRPGAPRLEFGAVYRQPGRRAALVPDGRAAVTRHAVGDGSAAYVSTRLGPDGLAPVLADLLDRAAVRSELPAALRGRVELALRDGVRFLLNRTDEPVDLDDGPALPPHGVVVLPVR